MDTVSRNLGSLTLDQYIAKLQELRDAGVPGDTVVQKWTTANGRQDAPAPVIAFHYKKVDVPRGDFKTPRFWQAGVDRLDEMGEQVVRV